MANDLAGMARKLATGVTPIVVGLVLTNNVTLIPFVPEVLHTIVGWASVAVGAVDLFTNKA